MQYNILCNIYDLFLVILENIQKKKKRTVFSGGEIMYL